MTCLPHRAARHGQYAPVPAKYPSRLPEPEVLQLQQLVTHLHSSPSQEASAALPGGLGFGDGDVVVGGREVGPARVGEREDLGGTAATTRAPIARPISTAASPTPPAAPSTSRVSPASSLPRSSKAWIVVA